MTQYLPKLDNAINDGKEVAKILTKKYGFNITTLQNATEEDIFLSLNKYKTLNEKRPFNILLWISYNSG